ncbi:MULTISPECIES: AI-2E family transporter [Bacillus]|uniref:AI-2E family transporter n=1 Tax=Bacillus TaxID=1386 RepID=UPI000717B385|nr:AI-2E family transporter [Bacillus pumilus]AMM98579.1 membrane protein [Bacillus pumilus]KRU18150.1 hypothetical protein AS142_04180 [Bacillus pumilus]MCY7678198.1 AI-2E family transporter [Bacillus pumilus]MDH3149008.1 AI-2E family transporter [Bacillus pumilus]MEB2356189.1 AI-2E family transporter [Bacillus pumilus]
MLKSKVHFWTFQILLVLLIVYVSTKVSFLFQPIILFASTLFVPILLAGILFFIFNPIVQFLSKKIPRTLAILIIYLLFIGLITFIVNAAGPVIISQVGGLVKSFPGYVTDMQKFINDFSHSKTFTWMMSQDYVSVSKFEQTVVSTLKALPENIASSMSAVFGVIANIALAVITVPFILFYMLKDGHKFPDKLVQFLPMPYRKEGLKIFKELNDTLAAYIQGQIIVCLFVGVACFIGYLLIGVKYALILGIIIAVTNVIPYLGPYLGAAPAVLIAFLDSPGKAVVTVIVILVVQQIDGNVISPLIIGKRLNTHPLTIILLLIGAGSFGGILGMIFAVPVYALLKAITLNIVRLVQLRQRSRKEQHLNV